MAYQANIKIERLADKRKLKITDLSVGNEIPTSRVFKIVKTDLTELSFSFISSSNELIVDFIDKDYAIHSTFTATVAIPQLNSVYTVTKDFITTSYISSLQSNRAVLLKVDKSIEDKEDYIKVSMEIDYYITSAEDRVRFCDLQGAQELLDYANNIANG